jgi:hypothetical protein
LAWAAEGLLDPPQPANAAATSTRAQPVTSAFISLASPIDDET